MRPLVLKLQYTQCHHKTHKKYQVLHSFLAENGTVDFPEFVQYMGRNSEPIDEERELKEAFSVFDENGDGCITVVGKDYYYYYVCVCEK